MNTKLDNRKRLIQIVKSLNDTDAQQLLTFALGIEIGKKLKSVPTTKPA